MDVREVERTEERGAVGHVQDMAGGGGGAACLALADG